MRSNSQFPSKKAAANSKRVCSKATPELAGDYDFASQCMPDKASMRPRPEAPSHLSQSSFKTSGPERGSFYFKIVEQVKLMEKQTQ